MAARTALCAFKSLSCLHTSGCEGAGPQLIDGLHLHGVGVALKVDIAVFPVVSIPGIKGCRVIVECTTLQTAAVAVSLHDHIVHNQPGHYFDHGRHTIHGHMAMFVPCTIKADSDGHGLVSEEVGLHVKSYCSMHNSNTPVEHTPGHFFWKVFRVIGDLPSTSQHSFIAAKPEAVKQEGHHDR